MSGPLIVNFDYATRDGVVEGSLAVSDLDDVEVRVGDTIGVMDSGAGPYEAEVIAVDADRIRVRAPASQRAALQAGARRRGGYREMGRYPQS